MKLAVLVALVAGCGGADAMQQADAGPPAPTLTVGSSEMDFVELIDGGPILLHEGTQGGFHVYLGLRATGVDPGTRKESPRACTDPGTFANPCVDFDVIDLDTGKQIDAFVGLRYPLTESAPGAYDLLPPRLVTLAVKSLDETDGHRFRVKASLVDAERRTAERELTVTCTPVR